jgi:hypothetical protein
MGVVKSTKTWFEGKEFVRRVRFSSRDGRFAVTLPKVVERTMGICEVGSDTFEGVEREYKRVLKKYRESKTTERKVIIYKVEANAWVVRTPDGAPANIEDDDGSVVFQVKDISFADGCGITVYADVMIERTLRTAGGEESVSYEDVEGHTLPRSLSGGDSRVADQFGAVDDAQVIDWTPEREAWFRHVGLQLENMVMNVCETLGDPKKAVELMDSGRMLMAPKEERPTRSSGKKPARRGS